MIGDVRTGETGTGWIAGLLRNESGGGEYVANYRGAASTSDGKQVPEKEFRVTLPSS